MIVATCVATSPASSAAATGCCVTQARYLPDASAVKPARSLVKTDAGDAPVPRMDCVLLDMLNVLPVGATSSPRQVRTPVVHESRSSVRAASREIVAATV